MHLQEILDTIKLISKTTVAEEAYQIDEKGKWPENSLRALQKAGLGGLVVAKEFGGQGQGLLGLARACEILGEVSGSAALCYGMHCVGAAVIGAKATKQQQEDFLKPIAAGEHLTTLALSEPGTGAHFYFPQTQLLALSENEFLLNGSKSFVTNGSKADSYVISTAGVDPEAAREEFSCFVLENTTSGLQWGPEWHGLGMRGNSSRSLLLNDIKVPAQNLLGDVGDQLWYVFQVVAPYFLTAMSGTYLGIAQAAFNEARQHLLERSYRHSGATIGQNNIMQHRLGMLWCKIERTRQLLYHATREGDIGDPAAVLPILASKAEVGHCCVDVVNEAMTIMGGIAYSQNSRMDVLLRDARAAHVMSPTTDILYTWLGRALLEQPILDS
ncbi:alkylation response protein AidB-like acyl-CoA dehydrogenase [Pontibacter aydingkolensis]|uniref:Acyl-CoA/acyl-ACP dehydrogenase n=1 Tax=Pontibacter aydingkolensis TaxID=1911536 RepID=A0ABS7CX39_9BACT|nr:acyl-CoA dehydrogenase family protein [Pontibacter aydingkolensis]MBW7468399.1 acyl-CoA/acyl-ACP dehydrogenase [Pontibacter aydingkolensis]